MTGRGLQEVTEKLLDERSLATLVAIWEGGTVIRPLPRSGSILIGRDPSCDLVIEHKSISRKHATIHLGDPLFVEDMGSSNKTKVGGIAIAAGNRVQIKWRDPVDVGGAIVVLRPPDALDGEASSSLGAMSRMEMARLIELVAKTEMSVLLLGETGVGKGHAAHRIHATSKRAAGPWLHLNCAALPENLLEAELFGYERGAFTGATQAKAGLLESASGGTVFLDEVGELPPSVQAKLLIALEHRQVMPLGSVKSRPIDVRFVAATNAAVGESATEAREKLRRDLYYRLAGMPIVVPPLRERKGEIAGLVGQFLTDGCRRLGRAEPILTARSLETLCAYRWPGNIRELAAVIERALLFARDTLEPEHLGLPVASAQPARSPAEEALHPWEASQVSRQSAAGEERRLSEDLREVEKRRIVEALERCSGNQSKAAALLGIARGTLISRMNEFGLPRPRK